jgi:hypothetical protein
MNVSWCRGYPITNSQEACREHLLASMIEFIELLRQEPGNENVYALNSADQVHLLSENRPDATRWVSVYCSSGWFDLTFLLPDNQAPWPGAYLCGTKQSAYLAVDMAVYAIRRCSAWAEAQQVEDSTDGY